MHPLPPLEPRIAESVRLVGGTDNYTGRVEVLYAGPSGIWTWAAPCRDGFTDADATVVCRELGRGDKGTLQAAAVAPTHNATVFLTGLNCSGAEVWLSDCPRANWTDAAGCRDMRDVNVKCTGEPKGLFGSIWAVKIERNMCSRQLWHTGLCSQAKSCDPAAAAIAFLHSPPCPAARLPASLQAVCAWLTEKTSAQGVWSF